MNTNIIVSMITLTKIHQNDFPRRGSPNGLSFQPLNLPTHHTFLKPLWGPGVILFIFFYDLVFCFSSAK